MTISFKSIKIAEYTISGMLAGGKTIKTINFGWNALIFFNDVKKSIYLQHVANECFFIHKVWRTKHLDSIGIGKKNSAEAANAVRRAIY